MCLPRFDSEACFAALVGNSDHGHWSLKPASELRSGHRQYRDSTLILETSFETQGGKVSLIDFMPPRSRDPDLVRIVVGKEGRVKMSTELVLRPGYGSAIPWVRRTRDGITAVEGPHAFRLLTPVELRGADHKTVAEFEVEQGQRIPFVLTWHRSYEDEPPHHDPESLLEDTEKWWRDWVARGTYDGPWREAVVRSLITLKALTYSPTGGIVAAPTTSLPEWPGGCRNWDYRFCWLRDATFCLNALVAGGYLEEARSWRDWLLRAVAGSPHQVQPLYGIAGERRLPESKLSWLSGFADSKPVRIGNAAHTQLQLDVFGELMDVLHQARAAGLDPDENAMRIQRKLLEQLERVWRQPDEGIWEVRGPRRQFTHSKVMAWLAFDRAVCAAEDAKLEGPVERWRELRDAIHSDVCREGFDKQRNTFVQHYGSEALDAALLVMPLVGFLPAQDPRMRGTVRAIENELLDEAGLVRRYLDSGVDGLPDGEGSFLMCSFWLADNYALQGRTDRARELFERLLSLRNDVGLLPEQYDVEHGFLGNFPQAFSHVALVDTALRLGSRVST